MIGLATALTMGHNSEVRPGLPFDGRLIFGVPIVGRSGKGSESDESGAGLQP